MISNLPSNNRKASRCHRFLPRNTNFLSKLIHQRVPIHSMLRISQVVIGWKKTGLAFSLMNLMMLLLITSILWVIKKCLRLQRCWTILPSSNLERPLLKIIWKCQWRLWTNICWSQLKKNVKAKPTIQESHQINRLFLLIATWITVATITATKTQSFPK